jgi:hypothetical protein
LFYVATLCLWGAGVHAQTVFRHVTSAANTSGHITTLDHAQLNGNPNAILQVTADFRNVYNASNVGVWYNGTKWTIYNQDKKVMSNQGLQFNVMIVTSGENHFIHVATADNVGKPHAYATTINHPKLNNNPSAIVLVTQNYGANNIYNTSEIAVWYTGQYWNVYNENQSRMPAGASFNVSIITPPAESGVHLTAASNIWGQVNSATETAYADPQKLLFITHNGNQSDWNPNPCGIYYPPGRTKWSILTGNTAPMPVKVRFNIVAMSLSQPARDLTGFYRGDNGNCGQAYIRQIGNNVYWFGEHPNGSFGHVFSGTISGNTLTGNLWDVPKGTLMNKGNCVYSISADGNTLTLTGGTIGCNVLVKTTMPAALPASKPMQAGGGALTGVWDCNDGAATYVREDGNDFIFFSEAKNNGTRPGFANLYIGKRNGNTITGNWIDVPKGTHLGSGAMTLRVESDTRFVRVGEANGYGGSVWTRTSSQANQNPVVFFEHCNFQGRSLGLRVGEYPSLPQGITDNTLSSLRITSGDIIVRLYEEQNFRGRMVELRTSTDCLTSLSFNDVVSSLKILIQSPLQATNPAQGIAAVSLALSMRSTTKWEKNNIKVCWENPAPSNILQRQMVQEAILNSWERYSSLRFYGWQTCTNGEEDIRIKIADENPHAKALGKEIDNRKDGIVLNFTFNNWCPQCRGDYNNSVRSNAIHEFGHALGFSHEHNRDDCVFLDTSYGDCDDAPQGSDGDWNVTSCDALSIMNYCFGSSYTGALSPLDIQGIRAIYGFGLINGTESIEIRPQPFGLCPNMREGRLTGDREFGTISNIFNGIAENTGHGGPRVRSTVSVRISPDSSALLADVYLKMIEPGGDRSTLEQNWTREIWKVETGKKIIGIEGDLYSEVQFRDKGAGAETLLCNNGEVKSPPIQGGRLLTSIQIIGDTGNEDISDDLDCNCDSQIKSIVFNPIQVRVAPIREGELTRVTLDNIGTLCPNQHVAGDRDFGGNGPRVNCTVNLRVDPTRTFIEAVVNFNAQETGGDRSEVRGNWIQRVFALPANSNMRINRINSVVETTASFVSRSAGGEGPFGCNDGYVHRSDAGEILLSNNLIRSIGIIGDTGGDDISSDGDCRCDTKITHIHFNPINITLERRL